jgi:hypothetical protein
MSRAFNFFILAVIVCIIGCAPYARPPSQARQTRYSAKVLYVRDAFAGSSLSGQSVLILPALTAQGPSAAFPLSPRNQSMVIQKVRDDLRLIDGEEFEKKYLSTHDGRSLSFFYRSLFKGNVVEVQTSDSVWKAVDAAYLLAVRLKYAAAIRGFDGNTRRRLCLETELWDVKTAETVWRVEVKGFGGVKDADDTFINGAVGEAFSRLPGVLPAANEKDW